MVMRACFFSLLYQISPEAVARSTTELLPHLLVRKSPRLGLPNREPSHEEREGLMRNPLTALDEMSS